MDALLRGVFIYVFLLLLFSITGRRALAEMDTFDLVLLLIISEATQNALVGQNFSLTYAVILILTLAACEVIMSYVRRWKPKVEHYLEGIPLIIVDHGKMLDNVMKKELICETDILSAARLTQGIEKLDEIKYAILETNGSISIIPYK
jgi:uncharacterized membrane protein YcaP (DUF421 family)